MTIGSSTSMTPMPATSNSVESMKAPVAPVQQPVSRDNEATEVSSADDAKSSSGKIDLYA